MLTSKAVVPPLSRSGGSQGRRQTVNAPSAANSAGLRPQPVDAGPCRLPEAKPGQNFTRIQVHTQAPPRLQAQLAINTPGDVCEQEADAVAAKVMHAHAPPPALSVHQRSLDYQLIQRKACEDVESRAPSPLIDHVLRSPGQPLDGDTRNFMEVRFGCDFSRVRVHTDADAQRSAREVSANAYTVGQHIAFGSGRFAPGTPEGRHLIAHELTHVVQQTRPRPARVDSEGGATAGSGRSSPAIVSVNAPAALSVQRDKASPDSRGGDTGETVYASGTVYMVPSPGNGADKLEQELLRRGILKPADYEGWGFLGEGYYFYKSSNSGPTFQHYRVVDALWIRNEAQDITAYKVISYLQPATQANAPGTRTKTAPPKKPATTPEATKPQPQKPVTPPPKTETKEEKAAPATAKTADQMQSEFQALPDVVKDLLRGEGRIKPEDLAQLLRIANKLKQLQPEDLALYKLLAKRLAADLDAFERSVDFFVQFKAQIAAQANAEKTQQGGKEPTLEEKLAKTWSNFDESKFGSMDTAQKEAVARDIAAQQRNIQLEHMASHPGETAKGMAEGIVRVDKTAKAIAEDVKDAADGNKGAYTRIAGAVGAYNKYVAAAAGIVFIALLFVPGVNLIELAVAGMAVAATTIVLSVAESELRIKAAGEAKTVEELKSETAKSAAAQTQAVFAAAMLALTLAMKIVARIPLPGRYQNVGAALRAAQTGLLEKTGVGAAWQGIKSELLAKLRSSKQGLPEALANQTKTMSETAKAVQAMSDAEFVKQLAAGDPKLADLGITADQAKAIQQLAATPEGKNIPQQLRKDSLQALQDAPVEAGKKVDQFLKNVDDSIGNVEKAGSGEQLKTAVDDANSRLNSEEQARQAITDEEAYVKKRAQSARQSGVREQAQKKLGELQTEKIKTQEAIVRLEKELSDASIKVNRLKDKVMNSADGPERAKALEEFKAAKEELKELREADELGGYKEERSKQNKLEEDILESLELKRPSLWQTTKDAIKKAAKKNTAGKFLDANTGEAIEGEPVYGHKYGRENRRLILEASEKGMTQEQFNQWVNEHPEWFQTETKANNESHRFEKPGID